MLSMCSILQASQDDYLVAALRHLQSMVSAAWFIGVHFYTLYTYTTCIIILYMYMYCVSVCCVQGSTCIYNVMYVN